MPRYASQTSVPADRSRAEIEKVLERYGASQFGYGWEDREGQRHAAVTFRLDDRIIRFVVPMPDPFAPEFSETPTGRERSDSSRIAEWEKATRQRWRALLLVVKAKLEAVDSEIASFEEEFLAYIVLPSGQTVGQMALPEIEAAYASGRMPRLLLPEAT